MILPVRKNGSLTLSYRLFLGYPRGVGIAPFQTAEGDARVKAHAQEGLHPSPIKGFWQNSSAGAYGLALEDFRRILTGVGEAKNYGLPAGQVASREQQVVFFAKLCLTDLVLARACAEGKATAWEHFMALYRQPLTRIAVAITKSETLGSDLADALYAELYGLSIRDGRRRCPLDSYMGGGSLLGWLRTTLAQRHIDNHRHTFREQPLDEGFNIENIPGLKPEAENIPAVLPILSTALEEALRARPPEDRFLLAAYYLDGRTQLQIAQDLNVSESKVSRKRQHLIEDLRKQVLRNLQKLGLSWRAAEEALGTDPRDLDLSIKNLLQVSQTDAFQEKGGR